MADLKIKAGAGSTNKLLIQSQDQANNDYAIQIGDGGATTLTNTTITAGTFPAGMITKYERTLSTNPTKQGADPSYADVTGTSVSYTPTTSASKVYYKTKFFVMGDLTDAHLIGHFKIVHDGSDVNDSRFYLDPREATSGHFVYGPLSIDYVLPAWTGAKTTKVSFRSYSSSFNFDLHNIYLFDGSANANLAYPIETIMYSIM